MARRLFYADQWRAGKAWVRGDTAGHLRRVLRAERGQMFEISDGERRWLGRIEAFGRDSVEFALLEELPAVRPPASVHLLVSLFKFDHFEWMIEKATELGVHAIQPVLTERTEVKLEGERAERRLAHWRGVVAAACEQSGRARLPAVAEPLPLHAAVAALPATARRLILDPHRGRALRALDIDVSQPLVLVIGPEGGLGERDLGLLTQSGFEGVRLGPRVLRTETAGLAVLAALQALYGDWA